MIKIESANGVFSFFDPFGGFCFGFRGLLDRLLVPRNAETKFQTDFNILSKHFKLSRRLSI